MLINVGLIFNFINFVWETGLTGHFTFQYVDFISESISIFQSLKTSKDFYNLINFYNIE